MNYYQIPSYNATYTPYAPYSIDGAYTSSFPSPNFYAQPYPPGSHAPNFSNYTKDREDNEDREIFSYTDNLQNSEVKILHPNLSEDNQIFDITVSDTDRNKIKIPFLSDHAIIWFTITLEICSWNLLGKCVYNKSKKSNNSFNQEETWEQFGFRVQAQQDKIIKILTTKNIDAFFLQELHFCKNKRLQSLWRKFKKELELHDYKLCNDNKSNFIIYNAKKLQLLKSTKTTLFTHKFMDLSSNKVINLVNVHSAPTSKISSLFEQACNGEELTIIGGDTNCEKNKGFLSLSLKDHYTYIKKLKAGYSSYEFSTIDKFYLSIPFNETINAIERSTHRFYKIPGGQSNLPLENIVMKPCSEIHYNNLDLFYSTFLLEANKKILFDGITSGQDKLMNLDYIHISQYIQKVIGYENRKLFANFSEHHELTISIYYYPEQNDAFLKYADGYIEKSENNFNTKNNLSMFKHYFTYEGFYKFLKKIEYADLPEDLELENSETTPLEESVRLLSESCQ